MVQFLENLGNRIAHSAAMQRMAPAISNTYWTIRKNAPEILTWGGIGLMGVACITTGRAAIRMHEAKKEYADAMEELEKAKEELRIAEAEYKKRKRELKTAKVKKAIRLFAGSVIEFGCGTLCVLWANHLLRKEILGLGAYVAALQDAQVQKVEDGEKKEEGEEVSTSAVISSVEANEITFIFGPGTSELWTNSRSLNEIALSYAEMTANTKLNEGKTISHVFLVNDLFRLLEMEHTDAGSVAGWIQGGGDPIKLRIVEVLEDGSMVVAIKPHGIVNNLIGKVRR